ncbi:FAD-binding oxidoreductase [Roseomonas sp. HJA6]|uniref:FAD-binding oxidoreductase n=1 Tax=Roseomonas alba TaxID=2846776 RepID=A0ABS7A7J2_9PROT|nr:FAD-binding oxidoreductase [Neoroseomonas alba]MBW6398249.1 FAD-binding oxidoreductase [Neoroseomonas alba]
MLANLQDADYDETLPTRAEVVVIGGGIAGVSTALALVAKGVSVAVCEKGRIGAEQSSRNWGWCRVMGRHPDEIPLGLESLRLWRAMEATVQADIGFRQPGTVWAFDTEAELAEAAHWLEHARAWQIDTRLLDTAGTAAVITGSVRRFAGALHTPSDGVAEPEKAVPAMARAARRGGATIHGRCAVRGLELRAGRAAGVVTERGSIACDAVVLAGGAWSRLFCGNLGIDLPQLKMLSSVLRTAPVAAPPDCAVGASNFSFRRRQDGGFTVSRRNASIAEIVPDSFRLFADFLPTMRQSFREMRLRIGRRFVEEWRAKRRWQLDETTPFEEVRVLDPAPTQSLLREGLENLSQAMPAFRGVEVRERWAGLIDVTPDTVPVISSVATIPGFHIATGFSGHGFGIGPGAGRLMADLVTGDRPIVDPTPFALGRFARSRPHTGSMEIRA